MKRVIVIDMAGEEGGHEAVRNEAAPNERKREDLRMPEEAPGLQTVMEEPFMETRSYYRALFDEYFKK